MTCVQPVDGPYFMSLYFWVTTAVVIVLAVFAAWRIDDVHPAERERAWWDEP